MKMSKSLLNNALLTQCELKRNGANNHKLSSVIGMYRNYCGINAMGTKGGFEQTIKDLEESLSKFSVTGNMKFFDDNILDR